MSKTFRLIPVFGETEEGKTSGEMTTHFNRFRQRCEIGLTIMSIVARFTPENSLEWNAKFSKKTCKESYDERSVHNWFS